jgi:hypothetical protein
MSEFLRRVVLPVGARRKAFNHFIGNAPFGYHGFDPSNNEFEVSKDFIDQATLDQKALDYAATQAAVDAAYDQFQSDFDDEEARKENLDNNIGLTSLIKVMVDELNAVRAAAGLPNVNFGQVNAAVRLKIHKP